MESSTNDIHDLQVEVCTFFKEEQIHAKVLFFYFSIENVDEDYEAFRTNIVVED